MQFAESYHVYKCLEPHRTVEGGEGYEVQMHTSAVTMEGYFTLAT